MCWPFRGQVAARCSRAMEVRYSDLALRWDEGQLSVAPSGEWVLLTFTCSDIMRVGVHWLSLDGVMLLGVGGDNCSEGSKRSFTAVGLCTWYCRLSSRRLVIRDEDNGGCSIQLTGLDGTWHVTGAARGLGDSGQRPLSSDDSLTGRSALGSVSLRLDFFSGLIQRKNLLTDWLKAAMGLTGGVGLGDVEFRAVWDVCSSFVQWGSSPATTPVYITLTPMT